MVPRPRGRSRDPKHNRQPAEAGGSSKELLEPQGQREDSSDTSDDDSGGATSSASGSFTHQAVAVSPHSLGTVDPDDLRWLTHPRLVHASLAAQRAVQALTSGQKDYDEIMQMHDKLRRIEDLHPLMARVQGLTKQRRDAATAANRSTTELLRQSATLEMCLRGLQKAAGMSSPSEKET